MPGALALIHQRPDPAIGVDKVMRADLGLRIAQPVERRCRSLHLCVVQDHQIHPAPTLSGTKIRRRTLPYRQLAPSGFGSVSFGGGGFIRVTIATPTKVIAPPNSFSNVAASSRSTIPKITPKVGANRDRGISWLT